jgi:hypothetical protein
MSSSGCLLLTKETLCDYKYNKTIMNLACQIRDTICNELEKKPHQPHQSNQTKYAFLLDERQQIGTYQPAIQIHNKSKVHMDVIQQLRCFFPDSKITVEEREQINGFTVSGQTYIVVDWT